MVDNASRVIKYVVTLGYRYQSYSLVDMRVQDINVVADLNRGNPNNSDPNEPVEQDGSNAGSGASKAYTTAAYQDAPRRSEESIHPWWTLDVFWPVLHILCSYDVGSVVFLVHYTVDLLGAFNVLQASGGSPEQKYLETWASLFITVAAMNAAHQVAIGLLAVAEFILRNPEPSTKAAFPYLVGGAIATFLSVTAIAVWYAETNVLEGYWLHAQAFVFYFGFIYSFFRYLIGLQGVKGIFSSVVTGLLMVHWGSSWENMMFCMEQTAKPLAWTKLVIASFLVFYCVMAAYHLNKTLGG
ncbi:MAG: hypothetical protein HXY34_08570 [Candidatus Thorarchaeota archaeon]|nr:hypothetical protein [Candidatus Thorarchaeota archaeon]